MIRLRVVDICVCLDEVFTSRDLDTFTPPLLEDDSVSILCVGLVFIDITLLEPMLE